jgi:hypothetical protein
MPVPRVPALLVAVAVATACRGRAGVAEPGPEPRSCDLDGVNGALVSLFPPGGDAAACIGTVVRDSPTFVLTAGHCAKAATGGVVARLGDRAPAPRYRISDVHVHPGFDPVLRPTIYDFALLRIEGFPRAEGVPLGADRTLGEQGTFTAPWLEGGEARWQRMPAIRNVLTLRLPPDSGGPCSGASGTPVLAESQGSFSVAAVVSRGPRTCDGPVLSGLVPPIRAGFVDAVFEGRVPLMATPSCGACGEELEAEGGPCATAAFRCSADPSCRGYLGRLDACLASGAPESCLDLPSNERITALRSCLCSARCSTVCTRACGS